MRVTQKRLEGMVEELNKTMGLPSAWTKADKGSKSNPGSFVLDAAYGGYRLSIITTTSGGENDVSGFLTARELYNYLLGTAMASGLLERKIAEVKEYAEGEEDRNARRRAAQELAIAAITQPKFPG